MSQRDTDGLSFRSYWRVIARWKWVVIVVSVLVTAVGVTYFWTRTPLCSSTANLLYSQQIDISNPLAQTYLDPNAQQAGIQSVPTIIETFKVQQDAEKLMSKKAANADYSVSADLLQGPNGDYLSVVGISATSPDATVAAEVANAYAQAFIQYERDSARSQVADGIAVVQDRLQALKNSGEQGTPEYSALQSNLQDLELLGASSSGPFRVVTQATPAGSPYYPDMKKGVAESLVLGLVLGIGLAFLLEQFDTRLHGEDQITDFLDLPIIGHVPPVGRKAREKGVLETLTEPTGLTAEAYRLLRSNLDFAAVGEEIKTMLVSSSLQGEGKSVVSCNLAITMAAAGKRIILIDADLRSPRVHTYFELPNAVGLSSVIARRVEASQALVSLTLGFAPRRDGSLVMTTPGTPGKPSSVDGASLPQPSAYDSQASAGELSWPGDAGDGYVLRLMTSGPLPPNPGEIVASRRFGDIIRGLSAEADLVIVDVPAMLPVGDTAAIASFVDAMVYIVNVEKVRVHSLDQARSQLEHLPCRKLGIIEVTDKKASGYHGYYSHQSGGGNPPSRRI